MGVNFDCGHCSFHQFNTITQCGDFFENILLRQHTTLSVFTTLLLLHGHCLLQNNTEFLIIMDDAANVQINVSLGRQTKVPRETAAKLHHNVAKILNFSRPELHNCFCNICILRKERGPFFESIQSNFLHRQCREVEWKTCISFSIDLQNCE